METRALKSLSELCSSFQYGTSSKSLKAGKVAVVRMGNLQNGEIDWSDLVFSNNEDDNEKYALKVGDVLFNRTNSPALVGKTSIYRGQLPAIFAGYLIRLNYGTELIGDYLNYMLNTHQAKEYCQIVKTDGVNQSNINAKKIAAFTIPTPSILEQAEIVRILDSVFEKEKQAKELASVIEKIYLMKKAILARAFRGELGTNDPKEESAMGLLKNIILEKIDSNVRSVDDRQVFEEIKIKKWEGMIVAKTIMEALQEYKELTPEKLKALTELEVDDFYDKLKELVEGGQVVERRKGGESFLGVAHES